MAHFRRDLTVLLVTGLIAQAYPTPAAPEPARHFAFTVFSPDPITDLGFVPHPGAAPVPVIFYPTARSPQYAYAGTAEMQFIDLRTGTVAAEITVPADTRKALCLFTPAAPTPDQAAPFRVQYVDESPQRHPVGTLRILNLSGLGLSGTINGCPVDLPGGFSSPIPVGSSASVNLRTPFKHRSYQAYAETIPIDPSCRCLLILLPPYRTGSLEVQSRVLLDTPPPAAGGRTTGK